MWIAPRCAESHRSRWIDRYWICVVLLRVLCLFPPTFPLGSLPVEGCGDAAGLFQHEHLQHCQWHFWRGHFSFRQIICWVVMLTMVAHCQGKILFFLAHGILSLTCSDLFLHQCFGRKIFWKYSSMESLCRAYLSYHLKLGRRQRVLQVEMRH